MSTFSFDSDDFSSPSEPNLSAPGTTVGPQSRYRSADGSGNVHANPTLGAAGQPYTRTVAPLTPKSPYLPDPELVFDQLLRRRGFIEHAGGLNRLFFSFATVVIHVSVNL